MNKIVNGSRLYLIRTIIQNPRRKKFMRNKIGKIQPATEKIQIVFGLIY
jgi:hypothetical protein